MADLYIGLMSGTSMDALDAVLVDFTDTPPHLIASHSRDIDDTLREALLALAQPGENELDRQAQLDVQLGKLSAELCIELLEKSGHQASEIKAIGSHGQTIRHAPDAASPYSVQIGDPNTIAQLTGITTVADFRRRDMAAGGQGAPLVPAFHQALFHRANKNRVILNIGGISNITVLPAEASKPAIGFDTGPGNMLMDAWSQLYRHQTYDENGEWAKSGSVDAELLNALLSDPFLAKQPPKSTGREQYNLHWLEQQIQGEHKVEDVQATLCEFTTATIAYAIREFAPKSEEIFVCGGGARNGYLMERLAVYLDGCRLGTTEELGVEPQWMEAMAFAWLARQTLHHLPGNLPAVTGAKRPVILGGIYPAP